MKEAYRYKSFSGTDMVATCHMPVPGTNGQSKSVSTLGALQTLTYSIHMDRKPIRSIGNINAKGYVMGPRTIAGTLVFAVFNKHFAYETMENIRKEINPRYSFMADELPPFDITISFANEYGAQSRLVLYGVQLVNEGQVMSVNDVYTENTYQYVANDMEYLSDMTGHATADIVGDFIIGETPKENEITDDYLESILKSNKEKANTQPQIITSVLIKIETSPAKSKAGKGIASIVTLPEKEEGYLKVYDSSEKELFNMNLAHFDMPLHLELIPGRYRATYSPLSNDIVSNPAEFVVPASVGVITSNNSTPTIDKVTNNSVSILANDPKHKKIFVYEKDHDNNIIATHRGAVEKGKGVIEGLRPGVSYSVVTTDDSEFERSNEIKIMTFFNEGNKYNELKNFVRYNHEPLKNGTTVEYYTVIDEAKIIAGNNTDSTNLVSSIVVYKNVVSNLISTLTPADFDSQSKYESKIKELNKHESMAFELINIATLMMYNEINSFNTVGSVTMPQLLDARNNVLLLDKNTIKVEMYIDNTYVSEIPISKFNKYGESNYVCTVIGKPGSKYNVRAVGFRNSKSAPLEIYILTDQERYSLIEDFNNRNNNMISVLTEHKKEVHEKLQLHGISEELEDRITIEYSKRAINPLLSAPEIIDYNSNSITVKTDYKEAIAEYEYEYYMCIVDADKALLNEPIFKIRFNHESKQVIFTDMIHGIKGKKTYALWIEDSIGDQVSNCSTIFVGDKADESHIEIEDQRTMLYTAEKSDSILSIIETNVVIPFGLKEILNGIKNDPETTERNIYKRFLSEVLCFSPELPNTPDIIKSICKASFDLDYFADENYFSDSIVFDNEKMTLTLPKRSFDFTWRMHIIDKEDVIKTVHKKDIENNVIDLKDMPSNSYIVLYGIKSNLYTKSGFAFIDTLKKEIYGYKIKAEVMTDDK